MFGLKIKIPRIKLPEKTSRKTSVALAIVLFIILAASLAIYYNNFVQTPIRTWVYKGQTVAFRADLRQAAKVPVYPGDVQIYRDIMNPLVENVTIAFKDAGEEGNPYYMLQEFELVPRMKLAYMYMLGTQTPEGEFQPSPTTPNFNAIPIDSYANLPGKIQNPIIAIVHPMFANETSVRMEGHVTYISGKTPEELDLATARFLMIVLGIDVKDIEQSSQAG